MNHAIREQRTLPKIVKYLFIIIITIIAIFDLGSSIYYYQTNDTITNIWWYNMLNVPILVISMGIFICLECFSFGRHSMLEVVSVIICAISSGVGLWVIIDLITGNKYENKDCTSLVCLILILCVYIFTIVFFGLK